MFAEFHFNVLWKDNSRFSLSLPQVFFILLIAFAFSVGIYANLFVFKAFDVKLAFAAMLLPYGGFFLGGLIAWLFKLEWKLVKVS